MHIRAVSPHKLTYHNAHTPANFTGTMTESGSNRSNSLASTGLTSRPPNFKALSVVQMSNTWRAMKMKRKAVFMLRSPWQRRRHDGRVNLVLYLLLYSSLGRVLIHAVGPNPTEDLILREVSVRRESLALHHGKRASAIDAAAIVTVYAVARPVTADYVI